MKFLISSLVLLLLVFTISAITNTFATSENDNDKLSNKERSEKLKSYLDKSESHELSKNTKVSGIYEVLEDSLIPKDKSLNKKMLNICIVGIVQ